MSILVYHVVSDYALFHTCIYTCVPKYRSVPSSCTLLAQVVCVRVGLAFILRRQKGWSRICDPCLNQNIHDRSFLLYCVQFQRLQRKATTSFEAVRDLANNDERAFTNAFHTFNQLWLYQQEHRCE